MQELDISFSNNNKLAQNDVFNINYVNIKTGYNEDIINYLNQMRMFPISIINDIDNLLNKEGTILENKIKIESEETHEYI